jgi:hypothetical protein
VPGADVHRRGRLVEQEQARVGHERDREAQPLALTAGELAAPVRDVRDVHGGEHLVHRQR